MKQHQQVVVQGYFYKKRTSKILTAWRNITAAIKKGRIRARCGKYFNDKSTQIQNHYNNELSNLNEILEKLENDIKKEIDERKALAKIYDEAMTKGVDVFIRETGVLVGFDSSSKIS